jgi:hypothetical protein
MKSLLAWLLTCLLLGTSLASAEAGSRQEQVRFKKGTSSATVSGRIKGYQSVDYLVHAKEGQTLSVTFKPSNLSTYFNVLPPGTDEALFVGSSSGNRFEAVLPADGFYTIRVYLMRNAARRNETAKYTLKVNLAGEGSSAAGMSFNRTLELQGIRFKVTSANIGSINTLRIVPSGLEIDNSAIVRTIDGTVTGAETGDINADGSPEVYVYVTSAGSGSYGSLVAYSANRRKSLSEIYLPPVTQNEVFSKGYRGHDQFAVMEGILAQRFPVYRDSDTNATPTGGTRQLQHKLVPGEAGWVMTVDRVVEY